MDNCYIIAKKYRQIQVFAEVVALRIDYHLITAIFFAEVLPKLCRSFAYFLPELLFATGKKERASPQVTPSVYCPFPSMKWLFLLQSFEKFHQSRTLAGTRSAIHIEIALGIVNSKEGNALHVEGFA